MRAFIDIERELGLTRWHVRPHGSLYVPGPLGTGRSPTLVVRAFDGDLPADLTSAYASLLASSQDWIERDQTLAGVVRVEQPSEVGIDFIARRFYLGNSLGSFFDEEDPPESPDELAPMLTTFRALADRRGSLRDAAMIAILSHSIIEPMLTSTMYIPREEKFVVVDLEPTRDELEQWARLTRS